MSSIHNSDNKNKRADDMIEELAEVKQIGQGFAEILPQGSAGCSKCSSQSGCSTAVSTTLFGLLTGKKATQQTVRVLNPVYAKPGDKVVVGIRSNTVLKSSLLAYFLPLVLLLVFAIVGAQLFTVLGMNSEAGSILMGLFGLFAGFKMASYWVNHAPNSDDYEAVILRVVEEKTHAIPFYLPS